MTFSIFNVCTRLPKASKNKGGVYTILVDFNLTPKFKSVPTPMYRSYVYLWNTEPLALWLGYSQGGMPHEWFKERHHYQKAYGGRQNASLQTPLNLFQETKFKQIKPLNGGTDQKKWRTDLFLLRFTKIDQYYSHCNTICNQNDTIFWSIHIQHFMAFLLKMTRNI